MDIYEESEKLHAKLGGKLEIRPKFSIQNSHDLSLVYTPGVARICEVIKSDPLKVYDLTIKRDTIAIVTDGSAVLGLGNLGPEAALPVMEGKAVLFKEYAGVNAFPICLKTQEPSEIINIIKNIAPVFAGINLEDISAPRCFEIEESLQEIGIPVFHDDQHGTAIVLLAALINAAKLLRKNLSELRVVINGAGAAGTAIAKLLLCVGQDKNVCEPVKKILVCDSHGIISRSRSDIVSNAAKQKLANITNHENKEGLLADAIKGADVFIGVSVGNVVTEEMIRSMNDKPVVFAMANPIPEIDPQLAKSAGSFIVGTGRSDYSNQVNNVLVFPGIFRGAIDKRAKQITNGMKIAAAYALADCVDHLSPEEILPSPLNRKVAENVAQAVKNITLETV
jgi:malate dehydrogenase (oxaloacetate-decarboxylating)